MISIPNILTFSRLVLTPLFLIFVFYGKLRWAFIVFLISGLTDVVDGFLARRLKRETSLGAILDPVADKVLLNSSYVALSIHNLIPKWLTISFLFRDAIIVLGFLILTLLGRAVKPRPTYLGKANTFMSVVVVLSVLSGRLWGVAGYGFMQFLFYANLTTIILSGAQYTYMGFMMVGGE